MVETTLVNIKLENENIKLPSRGSEAAAGYDLYAKLDEPLCIAPHTTEMIGTGISIELPEGTFGMIVPRSGLASKRGLRPMNTPGTIDQDYRGELKVALHNDLDSTQWVEPNERIAQLIVVPYLSVAFNVVDELSTTTRASGGFGSSGRF